VSTIESFIYPTDAQLDCSKNVKIYIKSYMKGAPTCFSFSQPSSGSYHMCFAKVISNNNHFYIYICTVHSRYEDFFIKIQLMHFLQLYQH